MTNTVLKPAGQWVNADGLHVQFPGAGLDDAVVGKATVYGDDQELIADIDWHHLPAFSADEAHGAIYGGLPVAAIPAGAIIKAAVMTTTEAFTSSGSATLSIGLVEADGTEIDDDGLLDAVAKASMDTVGETVTGAGALIGTALASTGYIWVSVQTASFTAGKGRLKITYFLPTTNTPGLVPA